MVLCRSTLRSSVLQRWIQLVNMASGNSICINSSPPRPRQRTTTPPPTTTFTRHSTVSNSSALPSPSAFLDTRQPEYLGDSVRFTPQLLSTDAGLIKPRPSDHDGDFENPHGGPAHPADLSVGVPAEVVPALPVKKARKRSRRPKSDAYILNSEEPEPLDTKQKDSTDSSITESRNAQPAGLSRGIWAGWASALEKQPEDAVTSNYFQSDKVRIVVPDDGSVLSLAQDDSEESDTPIVPLAKLLSNFTYIDTVVPRNSVPGASTKRRKIELVDPSLLSDVAKRPMKKAREPVLAVSKPVRKPKSPKKKAQTITALAMAPYQPPKEPEVDQLTVSAFFADGTVPPTNDDIVVEALPQKVKKPRKTRTKQADGTATTVETNKPKKVRQKKVKIVEVNPALELYSPRRACGQMDHQDFLFGTSSQLMVEESPTFIRDMQSAIAESEMVLGPIQGHVQPGRHEAPPETVQRSMLAVSRAKQKLWVSASRDSKGGILRDDSGLRKALAKKVVVQPVVVAEAQTDRQTRVAVQSEVVSLPQAGVSASEAVTPPTPVKAVEDDSWALLSSSSPARSEEALAVVPAPLLVTCDVPSRSPVKSTLPRPLQLRRALETLDANVTPTVVVESEKCKDQCNVARVAKSVASAGDGTMRKKQRESKKGNAADSGITKTLPTVKRQSAQAIKTKAATIIEVNAPQVSVTGGSNSISHATKLQKTPVSNAESWANIDEISDDDAPATPSPRRRRRSLDCIPPVAPLVMSPSCAVQPKQGTKQVAIASTAKLKLTDEQWPDVYAKLSPQITATIRAIPRRSDQQNPSWLQKILLYDPIVLEDLTAWLNDQQITIAVMRPVKKAATKGRKKKVDPLLSEEAPLPQLELVREPLQAWMVQKWCEEKSICCLWREGLRGGVKARY